jgi:hypothetical protein
MWGPSFMALSLNASEPDISTLRIQMTANSSLLWNILQLCYVHDIREAYCEAAIQLAIQIPSGI